MDSTQKGGMRSRNGRGIVSATVFVIVYFVARGLLEQEGLPAGVRTATAILPVIPFGWMMWEIFMRVRTLDELEQRIQLEALALSFPLSLLLLMILGLLERAASLPVEDLSYRHVWGMLPLFYFLGLAIARRRYK